MENEYSVKYGRDIAKSELSTYKAAEWELSDMKTKQENLLEKWPCLTLKEEEELKKLNESIPAYEKALEDSAGENLDYTAAHAFLFDGISFISMYHNEWIEENSGDNYYSVKLTPDLMEYVCLGEGQKDRDLLRYFWTNVYRLRKNKAKYLILHAEGKKYSAIPIIINIEWTPERKKELANLTKIRTSPNGKQYQITDGRGIAEITLSFFIPMFKDMVEDRRNFMWLPSHLQRVLYMNSRGKDKEKEENKDNKDNKNDTEEKSKEENLWEYFDGKRKRTISLESMRKFIMELNLKVSSNPDASVIYFPTKQFVRETRPGLIETKNNHEYIHHFWELKAGVDREAQIYNSLVNNNYIKGVRFNTCKSWFDEKAETFELRIRKEKPLEIEYERTGIPFIDNETTEIVTESPNDIPF